MKKLLNTVLILLLYTATAHADHIIGGDITYRHLEAQKYEVRVTMFRDCDECLLAGKGGGNKTKDCGGFDLYLYTVKSSNCSRTLIEKVSLDFDRYNPILNLCGSASSKCSDNPNFAYGIEAHYYKGVIDFSRHTTYKGCNFELSIQTPMRKDNLTNISGTGNYFFTYSEINPWITHHSPQFKNEPTLLLNCGKDFSEQVMTPGENPDDSIQVSLSNPLKSRLGALEYVSEYSVLQPLKVWCGGDVNCKPDPTGSPFKGFYINQNNGLTAFRPVKCDENATVVYEIRKWVKNQAGQYELVSLVRRDIQYTVRTISANNSPLFAENAPDVISACVGESVTQTIDAKDAVTMSPTGPLPSDTVRFEVLNVPPGLSYSVKPLADAPYFSLELIWKPGQEQAGQAYDVTIRITDNACPLNASDEKIIRLEARAVPQTITRVEKLNCGSLYFNEITGNGESWSWNLTTLFSDWTGYQRSDTLSIIRPATYTFEGVATGNNGCSYSWDTTLTFEENDIFTDLIDPASLEYEGCLNEQIILTAKINGQEEFTASWVSTDGLVIKDGKTMELTFEQSGDYNHLELWVETSINGFHCRDRKPLAIKVHPLPEITSWALKEVCYGTEVDLMNGVSPAGGSWYSRHSSETQLTPVNGNVFNTTAWIHKHFDTDYILEYRVTDELTGCKASHPAKIAIKRLPQMELNDLDVCATGSRLSLKVLVNRPYLYETGRFTWTGLDGLNSFIFDQNGDWIDIPAGKTGKHRIKAVNKTSFGCENADTGSINLLEDIKIKLEDPGVICQDYNNIDLGMLTNLNNNSGNWYSVNHPEWISNGILSGDACGLIHVGYVIDQYGCFDQQELMLDIRCSPSITLNLPDTVCKNLNVLMLEAQPPGGFWSGEGVRNRELDLSLVNGPVELTYVFMDGSCRFTESHTVFVEESPVFRIGDYPQYICEGQIIEVNGIVLENANWTIQVGNGTYYPDLMNNRFSYLPSKEETMVGVTTFTFTGTGVGMCRNIQESISTKIYPKPVVQVTSDDFTGCAPFDLRLKTSSENPNVDLSDVQFNWEFGDPSSGNSNYSGDRNPVHQYLNPGIYDISLVTTHTKGCTYSAHFEDIVSVYASPAAHFLMEPDGLVSTLDPRISFINKSSGDNLNYQWTFGDGVRSADVNPFHSFPSDTGLYTVTLTATNEYGCSSTFTDNVYVGPDIRLFIPNSFTPNNKGPEINETFGIKGQNIKDLHVVIYNRWGERMNEFNGLEESWDGTFKGVPCMSGVYFYQIEAVSVTGKTYEYFGTIQLLR